MSKTSSAKRKATNPVIVKKDVLSDKPILLVAEDTLPNYKLIEAMLRKEYELVHAKNGLEAVTLFKEKHPALVLMDIKMPEMDGIEALKGIRDLSPDFPVIATVCPASTSSEISCKTWIIIGALKLFEILYAYKIIPTSRFEKESACRLSMQE